MDKTNALNIAQIYASAVKVNYNYNRIILFGSYAKGNFNDDSQLKYDMSILLDVDVIEKCAINREELKNYFVIINKIIV